MRDGSEEQALLHCEACGKSTAVDLGDTSERCIVACGHCGASIYWHVCAQCGLRYVGSATAGCAVCDADDLDDIEIG